MPMHCVDSFRRVFMLGAMKQLEVLGLSIEHLQDFSFVLLWASYSVETAGQTWSCMHDLPES